MSALIIPRPGSALTAQDVSRVAREIIRYVSSEQDLQHVLEIKSRTEALEAYLRSKKLSLPMLGALRLVEARVGVLLGKTTPGERTDLEPSHVREGSQPLDIEKSERHRFRILARGLEFMDNEQDWQKSRRQLISEISQYFGIQEEEAPLPEGTYSVIYADPPWRYEAGTTTENRVIENQYPTMSLDEICMLNAWSISAPDSVLFLWATSPLLAQAMDVMKAWGFEYTTCAVWDKEVLGMGYYFRQQHEILLFGKKGDIEPPAPDTRVSSVIRSKRSEHSRKPEMVYEIIERMYPNHKRIELFARQKRDGWEAWGNDPLIS